MPISIRYQLTRFILNLLSIAHIIDPIKSWSLVEAPLKHFNLNSPINQTGVQNFLFEFSNKYDKNKYDMDQFTLLKVGNNNDYLVLGARNRLITISLQDNIDIKVKEFEFPIQELSKHKNHSNYVIAMLPIKDSKNNVLVCITDSVCPYCVESNFDEENGVFNSFDSSKSSCAPQFISKNTLESTIYYTTNGDINAAKNSTEVMTYVASQYWNSGQNQYISMYKSNSLNYKDNAVSKYVGNKFGNSKKFTKFLENNEKIFLFQSMISKIPDPLEKSRDKSVSSSLISQICKNDEGVKTMREPKPAFYSELTAQINCFKSASPKDGNSKNFRFEILEFLTDFIHTKQNNSRAAKKLFYGVFNTPEEMPTGTAICFYDINDVENVFQWENFDFENLDKPLEKSDNLQNCPKIESQADKEKYRKITNFLKSMKTGAYPIKRRKASFITLNRYRINTLVVDQLNEHKGRLFNGHLKNYEHKNIIYAGTDNGKVLRIAHYFTNNYFENEDVSEENVEVLEEIQLFDKNVSIIQLKLLEKNGQQQLFAISKNAIKSIPTTFCELYSDSCEMCIQHNSLDQEKCMWTANSCVSKFNIAAANNSMHSLEQCQRLKTTTLPSTTESTTSIRLVQTAPNTTFFKILNMPFNTILASDNDNLMTIVTSNETALANDTEWISKLVNMRSKKTLVIVLFLLFFVVVLILGVILGYLLKSAKFFRKFESGFQTKKQFDINRSHEHVKKYNSYQNQLHLGTKNELAKAHIVRSASLLDKSCNKFSGSFICHNNIANESVEKSLEFSSSSISTSGSNDDNADIGFDEYKNCVCKSQSNNIEFFTVQNDYSLSPNRQKHGSLKVSDLKHTDSIENKHRLSSISSTDSSYLLNLVNYSQTRLINSSSKNSSVDYSKKSIILNDTDSNIYFCAPRLATGNVGKFSIINSVYTQSDANQNNCIIVNDEASVCDRRESSFITRVENVLPDRRGSVFSSSISFSPSTNSSKSTKSTDSHNRYHKHHHLKKHSYNIYCDSHNAGKLVVKNESRPTSSMSASNHFRKEAADGFPSSIFFSDEKSRDFYINNSYV